MEANFALEVITIYRKNCRSGGETELNHRRTEVATEVDVCARLTPSRGIRFTGARVLTYARVTYAAIPANLLSHMNV